MLCHDFASKMPFDEHIYIYSTYHCLTTRQKIALSNDWLRWEFFFHVQSSNEENYPYIDVLQAPLMSKNRL